MNEEVLTVLWLFLLFVLVIYFAYSSHENAQKKQQSQKRIQDALTLINSVTYSKPPVTPQPAPVRNPCNKAQEWLASNALILDTETTGLDDSAQIVDIAIIDCDGNVLLNTLIKPTTPISRGAQAVHGITGDMVANAPSWSHVHDEFCQLIAGRTVVIYNSEFDIKILHQTIETCSKRRPDLSKTDCAMLTYAAYNGSWNSYYGSYRWLKLEVAARQEGIKVTESHRALGDCLTTLGVIKAMANGKARHEEIKSKNPMKKIWDLKREGKLDEAATLLLKMIDATEKNDQESGVSPECYEQLAIVYRKQKKIQDEIEILRRYANQKNKACGPLQDVLAERLVKAEALLVRQTTIKPKKTRKKESLKNEPPIEPPAAVPDPAVDAPPAP